MPCVVPPPSPSVLTVLYERSRAECDSINRIDRPVDNTASHTCWENSEMAKSGIPTIRDFCLTPLMKEIPFELSEH